MKKTYKNCLSFLMGSVILFQCVTSAGAHGANTTGIIYGDSVCGWIAHENGAHWANSTTQMKVGYQGFSANSAFITRINSAVNTWNNASFNGYDLINMTVVTNPTNANVVFVSKSYQEMNSEGGGSAWALTMREYVTKDNNNHITKIEIWVNWDYKLQAADANSSNCGLHTALHEIGHAVGLNDISTPTTNLMYNKFGGTQPVP
jgi:predicted Zn-dependent protease